MRKVSQIFIKSHLLFPLILAFLIGFSVAEARNRLPEGQVSVSDDTSSNQSKVSGSIIEDIDQKYKKDFEKWKKSFLAIKSGQALWDRYDSDPKFRLRFTVSGNSGGNKGAETDGWVFDSSGKLIGATITLGSELGTGVPNPLIYPILGHLVSGHILGFDKVPYSRESMIIGIIAHEFGHVDNARAAGSNFQRLITITDAIQQRYKVVGSKGMKNDPQLVRLVAQLEDLNVHTDEESEFLAESSAARVLSDYFGKDMPFPLRRAIQRYNRLNSNKIKFSQD
jgi:hypothetical protein